jgi:glutamate formiminotransferase
MKRSSPDVPLIECVPNFSEARRQDVIDALVSAIAAQPVHVLNVSSDPDHNRTVITFAGEPKPVVAAAFDVIAAAARLIDLTAHTGVHPRIGATDVVPFVPLRGISLEACAALAIRLGERVGMELGLPVYLYEAAARRPERRSLANIRRGGYEVLREDISSPSRTPDFGPLHLGSAGAVVIGARAPLIAFNAFLDTNSLGVARAVAHSIRESGGGLPYLRALGLLVGGAAQVSMNITDFRQTSLFRIMSAVRAAAAHHGAQIVRTELIGLIPQAALLDYAIESLQLPMATRDQVLEQCLGAATGDYRPVLFE